MLLKKKVERTLFVALIGFCKYGISDLDHEEGVYTCREDLTGVKGCEVIKHFIIIDKIKPKSAQFEEVEIKKSKPFSVG
jgi:hypothetical protein